MKRSGPIRRKKPIRRTSQKKRRENEVRREVMIELVDERGLECEAVFSKKCKYFADDGHEILTRGRGGSAVDKANIVLVCRLCHDEIHREVARATEEGWLRSSHES